MLKTDIDHVTKLSMAGAVRTKEKCPRCKGAFSGMPLTCPECLTHPRKYYVDIFIKNYGKIKLYSDQQGTALDSWVKALRVLEGIRNEIDQHKFDPTQYAKKDLKNFLFETRIEAWCQSKKREVEKGNLSETYTSQIERYIRQFYLPHFGGKDTRDIRAYHVQAFYENLPSSLSLKYLKNIMAALENFFNTLKRFDYIKEKPSFPVITLDRKTPRWIDRKTQIEALNKTPEPYRHVFTFLAFQGVRPGEAMALKVKDLDLENELLLINRTLSAGRMRERVKSKIVKPRAINPVLIPMLRELCEDKHPDAFVFVNSLGRHFTESNLRRAWNAVRMALGLDINLYQATRHSWATNALKDGGDLKSIGDILGHTDLRTTLKYAHTDINNQRAVFKKQGEIISLWPQKGPKKAK